MEAETKEWFYNYICARKNSKCFYSLESFEKSTFEQNWRKPWEGPDSSINKKPFCVFPVEQSRIESSQVYTAEF